MDGRKEKGKEGRKEGFSSFLAEIKVFWKYRAYDTIRKTWNTPYAATENFGCKFLISFDVFTSVIQLSAYVLLI